MEVLVVQILTGGPWNLAIYGKGLQCQIFLDNRTFASEKVLAFKFRSHLGPLVPCGAGGRGGGKTLVGVQLEVKVVSAHALAV